MPTAPGSDGQWYQFWVNPETDARIRKVALKLHKQGRIKDENDHVVKLKMGPDGQPYVPHYAVGKYALLQLLNGVGKREP